MFSQSLPGAPDSAVRQLKELVEAILSNPEDWEGIYLHGSLAMGSFQPGRSDLDVLAVSRTSLGEETRCSLAGDLLRISNNPHPIEISFLTLEDLRPWRYPPPFQLHFSEPHRDRFRQIVDGGADLDRAEMLDSDLALHITVARSRGIGLWGKPVEEVLPAVPRRDFLDALFQDFDWAAEREEELGPYQVLNLCRSLAWCRDGRVRSKEEGGEWGAHHLPERFRQGIAAALSVYKGEAITLPDGFLGEFVANMKARIQAETTG